MYSSQVSRVAVPQAGTVSASRSLLARFSHEDRGSVAIIFAMTTMIVVSIVGGAVDYGRWLNARNQTQNAIDTALLAAGRTSQTTYGDISLSVASANAYYNQMKSSLTVDDTISFAAINAATSFTAKGSAYIVTPFLSIVGIDRLPVLQLGDVVQATSTIAQGGNAGTSIEIGLMLDTTGSMAGQKIIDLKDAAKDLVDIVIWDDQGTWTSKIGLAPFANTVNVGSYFTAITNQSRTGPTKAPCVVERTGPEEFTDKAPGTNAWATSYHTATGSTSNNCPEASAIVPLTSDKTVLKATIDGLVTGPSTAGALGTAWAWYLISPEWGNIFTGTSKPDTYAKQNEMGPNNLPKLQKIAILMTDGAYNTHQAIQNNDNSTQANTIRAKAVSICNAMKAKGIKVYTVGFQLGNDTNAINTLSSCATDATFFYNAANGSALRAAFRDIALKISALRLSH
jgi:Flp pilus assembly protein TadG